jgi:hypothetical protein
MQAVAVVELMYLVAHQLDPLVVMAVAAPAVVLLLQ